MKTTSEEINHPTDVSRSAWSAREDGKDWKDFKSMSIANSIDEFETLFESGTGIPS